MDFENFDKMCKFFDITVNQLKKDEFALTCNFDEKNKNLGEPLCVRFNCSSKEDLVEKFYDFAIDFGQTDEAQEILKYTFNGDRFENESTLKYYDFYEDLFSKCADIIENDNLDKYISEKELNERKSRYNLIQEFSNIDYVLLKDNIKNEYVAAWNFNKEDFSWGQGHYFLDFLDATNYIQDVKDNVLLSEELGFKFFKKAKELDNFSALNYATAYMEAECYFRNDNDSIKRAGNLAYEVWLDYCINGYNDIKDIAYKISMMCSEGYDDYVCQLDNLEKCFSADIGDACCCDNWMDKFVELDKSICSEKTVDNRINEANQKVESHGMQYNKNKDIEL